MRRYLGTELSPELDGMEEGGILGLIDGMEEGGILGLIDGMEEGGILGLSDEIDSGDPVLTEGGWVETLLGGFETRPLLGRNGRVEMGSLLDGIKEGHPMPSWAQRSPVVLLGGGWL